LYLKQNCPLCDDAKTLLDLLAGTYDFELEERDIYTNDAWLEKYQITIPVVDIGGSQLDANEMNYENLEALLREQS
jgi:glutaredoxin